MCACVHLYNIYIYINMYVYIYMFLCEYVHVISFTSYLQPPPVIAKSNSQDEIRPTPYLHNPILPGETALKATISCVCVLLLKEAGDIFK